METNLASSGFRLIVYDLDGTLLETLPGLHRAANLALADLGFPEASLPATRSAVGDGVRLLLQRLAPDRTGESEIDRLLVRFHEHYRLACLEGTHPRTGAIEFLRNRAAREGRAQAILTNKPQSPTDQLVSRFGLGDWTSLALGGDTPWGRKPDPAGLRHLIEMAGSEPGSTLVVGDGPADLAVAQAAGVPSVRVDGGYGDPRLLDAFPSTWRVADFREFESIWSEIEPNGK